MHTQHHEVAGGRRLPQEKVRPKQLRPRRDHDLGHAARVAHELGISGYLVVLAQRPRERSDVGRHLRGFVVGQQAFAEQHDDQEGADDERHANDRVLEEAKRATPRVHRGLGNDDVHRRAGKREH